MTTAGAIIFAKVDAQGHLVKVPPQYASLGVEECGASSGGPTTEVESNSYLTTFDLDPYSALWISSVVTAYGGAHIPEPSSSFLVTLSLGLLSVFRLTRRSKRKV